MDWKIGGDLGKASDSVGDSIRNSADQIVNSGGDFFRAIGRGDFAGAGEDLLSIGWETTNLITDGALNISADAIKRALIPDIPPPEYSDRKIMIRDAGAPRRIIYGTCRAGGVVRYIESSGDDSQTMHVILVFAAHSCVDIQRVYFNDELAFIGTTAQGKYAGKATMIYETGKQSTANPAIVASTPSGWTSQHKLLGQTYAYFKLEYDNDVYQGLPNIDAIIKGNDTIYDPRTGGIGYTENQALIVRDWLAKDYGYDEQSVNEASFIKGANICDEQMAAASGTEARYTCNGTLSITDKPSSGLEVLNGAGASSCAYYQGEIHYIAGAYEEPEATAYTEQDFFGGIQIVPMISAADRINYITGSFIDPKNNYEQNDFVPLVVEQYITEDKQELKTDSKFPFSNTQTKARRLAKLYMEQSRYGTTLSGKLSFRALSKKYGDRIKISIERLGWTDRVFRIVSAELGINGVDVVLQEDNPLVWNWERGDTLVVDAPPALNLPDGTFNPKVENIVCSEELYKTNDNTTVYSRINIAWDGSTVARNYEIAGSYAGGEYFTISDYLTAPTASVSNAQIGEWRFRIRSRNSLGIPSEWVYQNFTSLGKTAPPSAIGFLTAKQVSSGIDVSWLPVDDLDVEFYELRLDDNFGQDGAIYAGKQYYFSDTYRASGVTYYVRAYDTSGNYSAVSASFSPVITGPNVPQSVIADSSYNNVFIKWAEAGSIYPIAGYLIRKGDLLEDSQPIGESSGTFEAIVEQDNGVFRYWIQARDVAGNVGPAASALVTVDAPPDYVLRRDDYVDFKQMDVLTNLAIGNGGGGLSWSDTTTRWDDTTIRWDDGPSLDLVGPANNTEDFMGNMSRSGLAWNPALSWSDLTQLWSDTTLTWDQLGGDPYGTKITNGYDHWLSPTLSTAYARRDIDFGALIPSSRITVTVDYTDLVAGATTTNTLSISEDGTTWNTFTPNQLEINGTTFRYLRIEVDIDAPAGVGLVRINNIRFKLDVKQKTDQGQANVFATDPNGTIIYTNKAFLDIDSVVATPKAIDAKIAVTQFDDVGNQDRFMVLVFDRATGNRVNATVSWQVRGS